MPCILQSHLVRLEQRLQPISVGIFLKIVLYDSSSGIYLFIEVGHPNHHQFVVTTSCKIITFIIEVYGFDLPFVTEDCPPESSLLQVPDFDLVVTRY